MSVKEGLSVLVKQDHAARGAPHLADCECYIHLWDGEMEALHRVPKFIKR